MIIARISILMWLLLALSIFPALPAGAETRPQTSMEHSPHDYFVSGHRVQIEARVSDPSGIEIVRCYFRAAGEADYVFVAMTNIRRSHYAAVLPAPSEATHQIEYLFLSVNGANEVVKSQTFSMNRKESDKVPAWQQQETEGDIHVSMELDQVPSELAGFRDDIVIDTVESGLRFGITAGGIYQAAGAAAVSTSGAAAGATSAGTVTAASAGIGTTTLVAAGAAGAAAVGGTAAAVTSGGSSSRSSGPTVEDHYTAAGPYEGCEVPPQPREAFLPDDVVVAYNYIRNVKEDDTSYAIWNAPDGYSLRIDNDPAPRSGAMCFSTQSWLADDFPEGRWSVEFYYNNKRLYTDTFVVRSDGDITVDWNF